MAYLTVTAALLLLPTAALGQISCNLPQAGPLGIAGRSALVETPGSGWAYVTFARLDTRDVFSPQATREPYFSGGRLRGVSVSATVVVGVLDGLDAWAQIPFHALQFTEASGERSGSGVGDPRFLLRAGPNLVGIDPASLPLALAVRGGVKLPGKTFPIDVEVIPVSEGQRDWELALEFGRAFQRLPVYLIGWVGYRWRERNERADRDPGDERFAHLGVGGDAGLLTWRFAVQGLWGSAHTIEGVRLESARRQMLEIVPMIGRRVGPGELNFSVRHALSGRNLPAGTSLSLGYFLSWTRAATPEPPVPR